MPSMTIDQALRLAVQYQQNGNAAAAEGLCRQILAVAPDQRETLHLLGLGMIARGRYEEALQHFSRAAAQLPPLAGYQCDLGVVHRFLGQTEAAQRAFEKALEIDPHWAAAWSNLSETFSRLGRLDEAIACGQRAVALQPGLVEAHNNLGNALRDQGRLDEAVAHFQQALAINPHFADVHSNLAYAYIEMHRWDDAVASCDRALALQPDFHKAYLNRGTACMGKCDVVQAEQAFGRALELRTDYADAHWNRAIALLLGGQYEEGWREFEWRSRSSVRHIIGGLGEATGKPRWEGQPAEGQIILVHAEQGLGDVIQFARYLPLVREQGRAARVLFLCPSSLAGLLEQSGGWNAEIIALRAGDRAPLPEFDQQIALLSLPLALRRFEPLPAPAPYLRANTTKAAEWRQRLGASPRKKIGLVWRGNPKHVDDRRRSIDPHLLQPLLQIPDVAIYSLQVAAGSGPETKDAPVGLIDLTSHIADFTDTAALLAELDLVISVDTATAHLAGALGRPVWTLLPHSPDWRWGLDSESTPWYATMRLFRQKTTGAWDEVIKRVAAALADL